MIQLLERNFITGAEAAHVLIRFGIWCGQEGWSFYDSGMTMHRTNPNGNGWSVELAEELFKEWARTQEDL